MYPVMLITFKRPDKLKKCIASLSKCRGALDTELYIFSDGPKTPEDEQLVKQVRRIANKAHGFKNVYVKEHDSNLGLYGNLSFLQEFGCDTSNAFIKIEEDLVFHKDFLYFMNRSLETGFDCPFLYSISGHKPFEQEMPSDFYLHKFSPWGAGFWTHKLDKYNQNISELKSIIEQDEKLINKLNFDGAWHFWEDLKNINQNIGDGYHMFNMVVNGLTAKYPSENLVHNNGCDGSGSNGGDVEDIPLSEYNYKECENTSYLINDLAESYYINRLIRIPMYNYIEFNCSHCKKEIKLRMKLDNKNIKDVGLMIRN